MLGQAELWGLKGLDTLIIGVVFVGLGFFNKWTDRNRTPEEIERTKNSLGGKAYYLGYFGIAAIILGICLLIA
jgi:hypothetical protein